MFSKLSVVFLLLITPLTSWSAYDSAKIKNGLSENNRLFLIDSWNKSAHKPTWAAATQIKLGSIEVGDDQTEISSPYINFKQKNIAKERCNALAQIALAPASNEEKKQITATINASTVRHIIKYVDFKGLRFEIEPIMRGVFVRLHCRIKPI